MKMCAMNKRRCSSIEARFSTCRAGIDQASILSVKQIPESVSTWRAKADKEQDRGADCELRVGRQVAGLSDKPLRMAAAPRMKGLSLFIKKSKICKGREFEEPFVVSDFSLECSKREKSYRTIRTWILLALLLTSPLQASLQQTAPNNIAFATAARATQGESPALYVGAAPSIRSLGVDKVTKSFKLARIVQNEFDAGVATNNVLQPFTPAKVKIDGQDGDHPLFTDATAVIAQLTTVANKYPLFVVAKYDAAGKPPSFGGLFLVNDEKAGESLIKTDEVHDQTGEVITAVPAALAAGKEYVFAAVSKANTQFDDLVETSRGIAIFKYGTPTPAAGGDEATGDTGPTLHQVNATDAADPTPKALTIDLSSKGSPVMAFGDGTANSIGYALTGRAASMCWDDDLQRLYVGFNAVRANDRLKAGGVLGCCMAYPLFKADGSLDKFVANPLVDSPAKAHFFSDLQDQIYEASNPLFDFNDFAHDLIGGIPGGLVNFTNPPTVDFTASGFYTSVDKIKTCGQILQKAIEYVRTHPGGMGNNADDMGQYLRQEGAAAAKANIFATPAEALLFLSPSNHDPGTGAVGGQHFIIFGRSIDIGVNPAGANSDATLRDAIRARFVQLLKNAKIVNKAYALGNDANSVYTNSLDMVVGIFSDGSTWRMDDDTGVVTARNDGDDDLAVSIPRMAIMRTSTGRPYLIVHSIMSTSPIALGGTMYNEADNWIYALPLIPNALNGAEYLKGTIAAVENDKVGRISFAGHPAPAGEYQPPGDIKSMPKRFQRAVRVGGGNPIPGSWVQDLFVAGDSVYVTLAGVNPSLQGVFKSTAVFDGEGRIIDWTPATRVMGSVMQTFAAMVDPHSANMYALTQTPTAGLGNKGPTTGQVTQWGKGQAAMHGGSADFSLDTVLGKEFAKNKGGVHGVLSFDELTYGFPKKQLSMLMAYGFDGVALVQTGRRKGMAFAPFTKHAVADDAVKDVKKNVWVFKDVAVSGVGPITCGAVVHNPANWTRFYVGGYRGLAQLEVGYPNPATFMTNLNTLGTHPRIFNRVADIGGQPVGSVVAMGQTVVSRNALNVIDNSYLHVLTSQDLLLQQIVGGGATARIALSGAVDGTVLADGTLAVSLNGLSFVPAAGGAVQSLTPAPVLPMQMQVLAARDRDGLWALPATAYILGMGQRMPDDVAEEVGGAALANDVVPQLWRVAVWRNLTTGRFESKIIDTYTKNTAKKGTARPYVQYPELRLNFAVDGTMFFDAASRDGSKSDFLRVMSLGLPQDDLEGFVGMQASLTDVMSVDRLGNFKVGIPVRDTSTGAWLVPGDWGLRVNE